MMMKGCSTGHPPIHASVSRSAISSQNKHWLRGRNVMLNCFDMWSSEMMARLRIDRIRARTPPNLLHHRII